jgi:chorismate synthase
MFGNTFGENMRITTFGESHGKAIGAVIEGFPAGTEIDVDFIQEKLNLRKAGNNFGDTERKESDRIEILSGIFEGKSLGTPIAFIIRNEHQRSEDYEVLKNVFRPGHADFAYYKKYGHYDHRGGGRASARETAARVAAGAFATHLLKEKNIKIEAKVLQIGNEIRPDKFDEVIQTAKSTSETIGGMVECHIKNLPVGTGEPVFAKLQALLAMAMMGIPAAVGFEYKSGISGGISVGEEIVFDVKLRAISSTRKVQDTFDKNGNPVKFLLKGNHDVTAVKRAVPVVEAMAALVLADLMQKAKFFPVL